MAARPLNVALAWYDVPLLKLYVTPLVGFVTVIEPVGTAHVGCVTLIVGAAIGGQTMDTEGVHVPVPSGDVTVRV